MALTKTNGKELKTFWELSEPWWPKDGFVDGDSYNVNGVVMGDEFEPGQCADTDQITILSGVICSSCSDDEGKDLQNIFKKWRKSLTTRTLLVEVDVENLDEVIYGIKRGKGKIIS